MVSGSVNISVEKTISCNCIMNDNLQKFWALAEIPSDSVSLTKEELFSEEYFNETVNCDISYRSVRWFERISN